MFSFENVPRSLFPNINCLVVHITDHIPLIIIII